MPWSFAKLDLRQSDLLEDSSPNLNERPFYFLADHVDTWDENQGNSSSEENTKA